ncbi:hypothetical protein [uncultured Amnibacterium sp.]|uniref:hypothetical protein n=1 Tax=uncultured Amnibacterium sp. TaxID=1631851 RepID=UPI0035CAA99D
MSAAATTYRFTPGTVLTDVTPSGFRRQARAAIIGTGPGDLTRLGAQVLDWQL